MQRQIYFLERGDEEPTSDAIDQIGGPARGFDDETWPRFSGEPMIHLLTLDLEGRGLEGPRGVRAVAVFAHSLLELESFGLEDGGTAVVFLSDDELQGEPFVPEDARMATPAELIVEPFGVLENTAEHVIMSWADGIDAEDIDVEVVGHPDEVAADLLAELLDDEGGTNVSYAGGFAYNPSTGVSTDQEAGAFIMRLGEVLFGPDDANFAGGGCLFVFEDGAWAEQ